MLVWTTALMDKCPLGQMPSWSNALLDKFCLGQISSWTVIILDKCFSDKYPFGQMASCTNVLMEKYSIGQTLYRSDALFWTYSFAQISFRTNSFCGQMPFRTNIVSDKRCSARRDLSDQQLLIFDFPASDRSTEKNHSFSSHLFFGPTGPSEKSAFKVVGSKPACFIFLLEMPRMNLTSGLKESPTFLIEAISFNDRGAMV